MAKRTFKPKPLKDDAKLKALRSQETINKKFQQERKKELTKHTRSKKETDRKIRSLNKKINKMTALVNRTPEDNEKLEKLKEYLENHTKARAKKRHSISSNKKRLNMGKRKQSGVTHAIKKTMNKIFPITVKNEA